MPLIHIRCSTAPQPDSQTLLRECSRELASLLGKPERYVMTLIDAGVAMGFGGDHGPCAYVEVKSIGSLDGDQPRRISAVISALLERHLAVPPERLYIGFEDVPGRLWGWNGGTFS